jgi:hypothetical protein
MKTITKTITVEMPERVIRLKRKKVDAVADRIAIEKKKAYEEGYAAAKKKFEGLNKAVKKERWKKVSGHRMPDKKPVLVAYIDNSLSSVRVETAIYFKKQKKWLSANTGKDMTVTPILWCDVVPTVHNSHIADMRI